MNINKLRHYIFINPNNVHSKTHKKLNIIKKIHKNNYKNGEIIKYWFYDDIVRLLNEYDKELSALFVLINTNYPALLADIGRHIILYNFGGMYLDLKILAKKEVYKLINITKKFAKNIKIIGWKHYKENRTKNGTIISLSKKNKFFSEVLQIMKIKLKKAKEEKIVNARNIIFEIGSNSYIKLFKKREKQKTVAKFMFDGKIIKYNKKIYSLNFVKWQNTNDYLFL